MNTTQLGREAESKVAEYMQGLGYALLEQNWRTRWCEIDLVMKKNSTVYFVEVKYRSSGEQGTGLEYITAKKLKQMEFAAEMWVQKNRWSGDAELMAAEVDGQMNLELTQLQV